MSFWQEYIQIRDRSFPRFIGGPLDGITDAPFRRLVREVSKEELLYTEMRHVAAIAHAKKPIRALDIDQCERPLSFQVAANSVNFIESAFEKILDLGIDCIDLNIGCPSRQTTSSGSGSALMGDLPRLEAILKEMRRLLPIPFTVKMRAGFKTCNALDVALLAQDCGVDAIAVHPRLQTQRFEGQPDYALVAQVKKQVSIPVILSGGVVNWKTAVMAYEKTGADGYLIGRGLWAKPWKLKELHEHALGNEYHIDRATIMRCARTHFDAMILYYGDLGLYMFRKHIPFYLRGVRGAPEVRAQLMRERSVDAIRNGLLTILQP